MRSSGGEHRLPCGRGAWLRGGTFPVAKSTLSEQVERAVAASGAWTDDDTFTVKACFYESPF